MMRNGGGTSRQALNKLSSPGRQGSSTWSLPQLPSSSGTDLGAIASALSPALATLEETLQRVRASASIAPSPKKVAFALRVGCGSRKNKESCLTFFRGCIDFAEKIAAYSATFMAQPTFSRVRASNDLQERVVALGTEAAGVSSESATQFPDSLHQEKYTMLFELYKVFIKSKKVKSRKSFRPTQFPEKS
ncbi:hypothetical protein BC826DRAFT_62527 [Russula brevipes]|nr:hypothetical protein BC826DRAFT_62527 [Russula brevipes]